MNSNAFITAAGLVLLSTIVYLIVSITINTAPKFKCVDGVMYENYMTGDVWVKTQKQCVEIK